MVGRNEGRVKPVFLRNGEPIPVWLLAKLAPSGLDIPKAKERGVAAKSGSRSEAAKKAWTCGLDSEEIDFCLDYHEAKRELEKKSRGR